METNELTKVIPDKSGTPHMVTITHEAEDRFVTVVDFKLFRIVRRETVALKDLAWLEKTLAA